MSRSRLDRDGAAKLAHEEQGLVAARRIGARRVLAELLTASRFVGVGAVATLVHLVLVWVLVTRFDVRVYLGNLVAFLCAFAFSFVGHHFWTFRGHGRLNRRFVRFVLISVAAFLANSVVLAIVLHTGFFSPAVAAVIAAAGIPVMTFVASRAWGFRGR